MALLRSLSSRSAQPSASAPVPPLADAPPAVQLARTRARQRLIGALLLLTVGVIGFPLLFDSRPRPIPLDIPIEIPARESAAPLLVPAEPSRPFADSADAADSQRRPPAGAPSAAIITETPADAGRDVTSGQSSASASRLPPIAGPRGDAATRQPARPDAVPQPATGDAARAQALLDGKPSAKATLPADAAASPAASAGSAGEPRYIVQVGAFADPTAARETRLKVERLGLKTYTQVAETPGGPRTRVRVGPFAERAEADRAMARVKAAGVAAAILTL